MQIFALDENRPIQALGAMKGKNYICPECGELVRLKAGKRRVTHFFHPKRNPKCLLAQKGLIHLRLQRFIQYLFDDEGAEIEKAFPSIGRIADVACIKSKRIYEIQYSPMTLEEAKARCNDYESIGFQVIWILHDATYNRRKMRPVEQFLLSKNCYYANMDTEGNGMIYDQLSLYGKRPINLRKCHCLPDHGWPNPLFTRGQNWSYYHEGDFFDLALRGQFPKQSTKRPPLVSLRQSYLKLLYMLLKRSCK